MLTTRPPRRILYGMEKVLHVGFESSILTFEKDITIDELIEFLCEHVEIFDEAVKAAELISSGFPAGSYQGTGWRLWFVKRESSPTLH